MEEKVLTTPTGVDLFKNANGILYSSDMEEVKKYLALEASSEDDFNAIYAEDLLDLIVFQSGKNENIREVDGIVSNGHHLLSGLDSNGHFIIDGETYQCDLDPDDGYGKIWPSLERCNNTFDPIEVYVQWEKYDYRPNDNDDENYCDVYMVIISYNSKIIAKMGTRRYEIRDWTPIFVVDKDFSLN